VGGQAYVNSVSCGSAGNCAAGGYYLDRNRHPQGFVASETNGRWGRAIEVLGLGALNTGAGAYEGAEVASVSCGSEGRNLFGLHGFWWTAACARIGGRLGIEGCQRTRAESAIEPAFTEAEKLGPVSWIKSAVAAVLKGALESLFNLAAWDISPDCSGSDITVTDSRPNSGIAACAQSVGTGSALAKIVNQRPYPVDLLYEPGAQVSGPATDIFTQLGEDLNNLSSRWHDRVLVTAGAEADGTVPLQAGQKAVFGTEMDPRPTSPRFSLGTGIHMLAKMTGGLAGNVVTDEVDAIDNATCLRDAANTAVSATMSLSTAESLGSVALECVATIAKGISDVVFTAASLAASLATELIAGIWGIIDTAIGNADHLITLEASGPAIVYLPCCGIPGLDQEPQAANQAEDYRPRTVPFDATGSHVLQNATWQIWNSTEAVAVGTAAINSCEPACAGGHYITAPVTITLSVPRKCGNYWFWSKAVWHFPGRIPPGERQDQAQDILVAC
jgi:hypothetical protein